MNRHQKAPPPRPKNSACRQALERLDAALEEHTQLDNYEKIRRLRRALFSDADKLQASDAVKIPE